ncbi:MAG: YggT family protein [Thermodesulfobacteriota bacterium]
MKKVNFNRHLFFLKRLSLYVTKNNSFAKGRKLTLSVIPVKAGIRYFKAVSIILDPGFHRGVAFWPIDQKQGSFRMFILANFIKAVAWVLDNLLWAYTLIIIAQALTSWVRADPYNQIVRFLYAVTEPVLRPIRRHLPVIWGGFDFSPLLVLILIGFLQRFLVPTLEQLAYQLAY